MKPNIPHPNYLQLEASVYPRTINVYPQNYQSLIYLALDSSQH